MQFERSTLTVIAESLRFAFVEHAVTTHVSNRVKQYYLVSVFFLLQSLL